MKHEIAAAGGVEVFAIGQLNSEREIHALQVHCRGNEHSVPALLSRPRAGEVVIHNHPSGILKASHADMMLANLYGEDGVGVVIVNNNVEDALWVVEPYQESIQPLDLAKVQEVFEHRLPRVMPNFESRSGQIDMALEIAAAFNGGEVALLEAGTGTGKSLAYLVPAAMWAQQNQTKVAIATFTIALQAQLVTSDIPILRSAGFDVRFALIKGRNNYLCRRRFADTLSKASSFTEQAELSGDATSELHQRLQLLQSIERVINSSEEGSRSEFTFSIDEELWEDIGSDHDQTLRAKCPHYERCFYYNARRKAAQSQLLILNHHLLLADLMVKRETGGEGILPKYNRLVLDEGHHLENSATSLFRQQLTTRSVRRAVSKLQPNRKTRPSAPELIAQIHLSPECSLDENRRREGLGLVDSIHSQSHALHQNAEFWFNQIHDELLPDVTSTLRIRPSTMEESRWVEGVLPVLSRAAEMMGRLSTRMLKLEEILQELDERERSKDPQPILEISKARKKIAAHSEFIQHFMVSRSLEEDAPPEETNAERQVRWVERRKSRHQGQTAVLCMSPVEVSDLLREHVFSPLKSVVACSATMTVDQSFEHYRRRHGLVHPSVSIAEGGKRASASSPSRFVLREQVLPTPFNYPEQALLAAMTDLPSPNDSDFIERIIPVITTSLKITGGGIFVLCTSYRMLGELYRRCNERVGGRYNLFRQGQMSRSLLLDAFIKTPNSVLFGADSFWEGVSVKGDDLKLVIIPRLPFRVPTDPVQQARYELLEASGQNPFREYALPEAALRLRQGFGRLIRTRKDLGAVLVLDKRIQTMWYGRYFRDSLPEMECCAGDTKTVLRRLFSFYNDATHRSMV